MCFISVQSTYMINNLADIRLNREQLLKQVAMWTTRGRSQRVEGRQRIRRERTFQMDLQRDRNNGGYESAERCEPMLRKRDLESQPKINSGENAQ